MSVEKRVRAYLELAAKDTEAAELLLAGGNRYSAYHLQQAVEKITKALLLARGIEAGIEHRLEELFKRFPSTTNGLLACYRSSDIPPTPRRFGIQLLEAEFQPIRRLMPFAVTSTRFAS